MSASNSGVLKQTSPDVLFYPFSDGGLLFRQGLRLIWVLNPASAFIWCAAGEARDAATLVGLYAEAFEIPPGRAEKDVAETLETFRREGLLGEAGPAAADLEDSRWNLDADGPLLDPSAELGCSYRRVFALGGHRLELNCQPGSPGAQLAPLLEHLAADQGSADTRVTVLGGAGGRDWDIYLNGSRWVEGVTGEAR